MPPGRDDGYLLMNSITEASQYRILKFLVQIHFTTRTETQVTINYSVFHKTYPFFLALHAEKLLKHQIPVCSGGKRHFSLQGDHKNTINFYMNWY